jgi:hypothetical protein
MSEGRTFGDLLRQHRLQAGLSQQELADRAGLSPRGVSGPGAGESLTHCLDWVAAPEGAHGRPARATQLFGAADAQWRACGAVRYAPERPVYEPDLATVRAAPDEEAFAAAWAVERGLHTTRSD